MQTKKSALYFCNVIVITILSCVANLAFAQEVATTTASTTATTTVTTPPEKEEAPIRTFMSERELPLQTQVRVTNLVANISNRIEAAHSRLTIITKRTQSRSQKLSLESYDTTAIDAYIQEANAHLDIVRTSMSTIDTNVKNAVTSETPRGAWNTIKVLFVENVQHLQSAKTALRNALSEMKLVIYEKRYLNNQTGATTTSQTETTQEETSL